MTFGVVPLNPLGGGLWTIRDEWGRLVYPDRIGLDDGSWFERAKFRESKLGVVEQYREVVDENSRHLYVLTDGSWIIDHSDNVNPDRGDATAPIRHFFQDHPLGNMVMVVGVAVLGAMFISTVSSGRGQS